MEFNTKQELYDYLNTVETETKKATKLCSVYFLVEFDNHVEPIYFMPFKGSWFESPCELHKSPLKDDELMDYVEEMYLPETTKEAFIHESIFQRDGWHYEIDVPQCLPFLPDKIKIIDILSEKECFDWLLKNKN